METLLLVAKEFGPHVILILFILYRDHRREQQQNQTILHLFKIVLRVVNGYNTTSNKVSDALNNNVKLIKIIYKELVKNKTVQTAGNTAMHHANEDSESDLHPTVDAATFIDPDELNVNFDFFPTLNKEKQQ
jgi:hypothetical protein